MQGDNIDPVEAGQQLRQLRIDRGWTATEFAAAAGCSTDQVKIYEEAKRKDKKTFAPKPEMVTKFANALGGGYRQLVLKAYGLPVIEVPQVIDLDQVAQALDHLHEALGLPESRATLNRVNPRYLKRTLSAVVNHSWLGQATHPTPLAALLN